MKPTRILTPNIDLLGEIDNYESLFFSRSWHGIGQLELRINRHKLYTDTLQKGNLIVVGNDKNKVYRIHHRGIELGQDGKITENWHIVALELKSIVGRRLTIPPAHTSHDNKSGAAETVIKHYVYRNIINPTDSSRKIPQLVIAPDQKRGMHIDWQSRYKNLADEIAEISLISGVGWHVYVDYDAQKWVFDVDVGLDLSANQDANPPVIFSPEFDNLKEIQFVDSDLNFRNVAIIAGQGEGVERRIEQVGKSSGLDRYEMFVDARDIAEEIDEQPRPVSDIKRDLINRGKQKLAEMTQEIYLEGQILTSRKKTRKSKVVKGKIEVVHTLDKADLSLNRNLVEDSKIINLPIGEGNRFLYQPVIQDQSYTISFDYRINAGDTSRFMVFVSTPDASDADYNTIKIPTKPSGRIEYTFTPSTPDHKRVFLYAGQSYKESRDVDVTFYNLKLEVGDTATPWQPALEDDATWYNSSKLVDLPSIDLSTLDYYDSSIIKWSSNTPEGTSIKLEYSFSNKNDWKKIENGNNLDLWKGGMLKNKTLYLRAILSTENQSVTPVLKQVDYEINGKVVTDTNEISTNTFTYEEDYNLGDVITLQNKQWGVTLDTRITEFKEVYEPGGFSLEATFGQSRPTLIDKIKQELSNMSNEIVR